MESFLKKIALLSVVIFTTGAASANADRDVSTSTDQTISADAEQTIDDSMNDDSINDPSIFESYDRRRRDHRRDYPRRYDYDTCYDQALYLVCKVNGRHQSVTGYTNCGRSYEGSYCYSVYVPGYRIQKMNVTYRCENGRWRLLDYIPGTGCRLTY
jgi:hypothetical protein